MRNRRRAYPVVVINHGTPPDKTKLPSIRLGFARAASWFVDHGLMVVIALRPGFGSSSGTYLEAAGTCRNEDFVAAGQRTAAIEGAIVSAAAALPGADPKRIVVIGQSAGGYGAVALADAPPPGVVGVISFAGGRGGNGKEHICAGEDKLIAAERQFGAGNHLPQLWLTPRTTTSSGLIWRTAWQPHIPAPQQGPSRSWTCHRSVMTGIRPSPGPTPPPGLPQSQRSSAK